MANLNRASERSLTKEAIFRDKKLKRKMRKLHGAADVGYERGPGREEDMGATIKLMKDHIKARKGSFSVLAGRRNQPAGFKMTVPEWIQCQEHTFWQIVKIAALQMAGISLTDISQEIGISRNRAWELRRLYPEEFAYAQKQMIQHAAIQLGVNLFAFKSALLDIMPDCLYWMTKMINDEKTGARVRTELIKTVIKSSGVANVKDNAVEKQINEELANFLRGAASGEYSGPEEGGMEL